MISSTQIFLETLGEGKFENWKTLSKFVKIMYEINKRITMAVCSKLHKAFCTLFKEAFKKSSEVQVSPSVFNPKQTGGDGIRPQAGSSLCCAETVSSRKLKLCDFYFVTYTCKLLF